MNEAPGPDPLPAIRIVIASDICLYREGLSLILGDDPTLDVVAAVCEAPEVIEAAGRLQPDIVLMDIAMSGALAAIREVLHCAPGSNMVALTVGEREDAILACAEAGVVGFVTRGAGVDDLCRSIHAAHKQELYCSPKVAGWLCRRVSKKAVQPEASVADELTEREREILELIDSGLPNKGIARRLCIELPTVKSHVHNILRKLDASTRGEAAAILRRSSIERVGTSPAIESVD